jgi:two-component system invasion response regulator UvrY
MRNFLLIDDHSVMRSGIKMVMNDIYKGVHIDEAGNGEEALMRLKSNSYELVIMDVQMPDTDTLGLAEYVHISFPDTKILMFSMSPENIYALPFFKIGVNGFVSKEAPLEEFTKAVDLVLNGRSYISQKLTDVLARESIGDKPSNPFKQLSRREFEIVTLLITGKNVTEISRILSLQTSTIGTHKARIFDKLRISNILELKELVTVHSL